MARFLGSRRAVLAAWVLGITLSLPALGTGFVHDDLPHRVGLEGEFPEHAKRLTDLYDFTDSTRSPEMRTRGTFP